MKREKRIQATLSKICKRKKYDTAKGSSKHVVCETPKVCSCHLCGNPRRFLKGQDRLTIQERKWVNSLKVKAPNS